MASSLPAADGPGAGGRRSVHPAAIVAGALAALLLVAMLADGRLLVADPDASAVTDADVRLARELFGGVTPPASLVDECFADDGTIEPACLGDGRLDTGERDDVRVEVVPRSCREDRSISADCVERELDVEVPGGCTRADGGVDVGCLAEAGTLLVLTDQCLEDGRVEQECLTLGIYGVPAPDEVDRSYDRTPETAPDSQPERDTSDGDIGRPEDLSDDDPEEESSDEGPGPLERVLDLVGSALGVLLLIVLTVGLVGLVVWAVLGRGPRAAPVEPDVAEEDHDRAVMAASVEAGARQLDLSGDPRAAIIAAYALLLEGLAACAQGRRPAETPLEHLERVLAALDVRPDPLRELTTLFGEARFSDHAMTDAQRDRARAALAAAAVDLERVRETVG